MIRVLATLEIAEECLEQFLARFRRLVPLVRAENGCLEYEPFVDIAAINVVAARPNTVTIVEKWASIEALQDHLMAPHMLEYRKDVKEIVLRSTLAILEPA